MVETILWNHRYLAMEKLSDKGHHNGPSSSRFRDAVVCVCVCVCVCVVYMWCVCLCWKSGAILAVSSHIVTTERR